MGLEALLSLLAEHKIPVFGWGIGEVQQMDVRRVKLTKGKKLPEYAIILAFDVKVNKEAQALADKDVIKIFTAEIIYHLLDEFKVHMENAITARRTQAIFPVVMQIDSQQIFRKKNGMIFGVDILDGQLHIGTPICIPDKDFLNVGYVTSIVKDNHAVQVARRCEKVSVKIEQDSSQSHITYGRHFNHKNRLLSMVTQESIYGLEELFKIVDGLEELFRDDMRRELFRDFRFYKEDWTLLKGMKKLFPIP